jgi:hypothetical protein
MKWSPELEAKLAGLNPLARQRVLAVAKRHAKARLANMLDQTSASHERAKLKSNGAKPR